jgi:hypothetical protein
VGAESVTAAVPASSLAQPGTGIVTVVNPAPGGGSSNLAFFEVTATTPSAIMFEKRTYTPTNTNSLVAGDFNGDGKLDLAVSTGATLSILLGKGDGTFNVTTFPTTAQFVGTLVTGDFNGDGKLDLAFPDPFHNLVHLLLGNGDGTFNEVSTTAVGTDPVWAAAGDFNGDGKLDLAVVNRAGANVSILLGKWGRNVFSQAVRKGGHQTECRDRGRFQRRWQARLGGGELGQQQRFDLARSWRRNVPPKVHASDRCFPLWHCGFRFQWRWEGRSRRH